MISLLKALCRPEYFYNPRQLWFRSLQKVTKVSAGESSFQFFGKAFRYSMGDDIGRALHSFGLYDLCVSEALWRLCRKGDVVADVGANIGYFSSLMSKRAGSEGVVLSFEPNPQILEILKANTSNLKNISLHTVALSEGDGLETLYAPSGYVENRGLASLSGEKASAIARVELKTLDSFNVQPRILKMDVEGHELQVLKGAVCTLKTAEHVVFEEHDLKTSGVRSFLEEQGFKIFYLQKKFSGLVLREVSKEFHIDKTEPPNFLATRWSNEQIKATFSGGHWSFLKELRECL